MDRTLQMRKRLFIVHHLGLGDHLICNGLYREKADNYKRVVFLVKRRNGKTVKRMLSDVGNISVLEVPATFSFLSDRLQSAIGKVLLVFGWTILRLGSFGKDFMREGCSNSFDEQFYDQAGVSFDMRWERGTIPRDSRQEALTLRILVGNAKEHVFVHDDVDRGFHIENRYLPSDVKVVRPIPYLGLDFFSHAAVIETAKEVHLMGSSFLALAQGLRLESPAFVHDYARSDTASNPRLRQTLKGNWTQVL